MPAPIIVGVALNERDAAPLALGRQLAGALDAPLHLVHASPYEPLTMDSPEDEAMSHDEARTALYALESALGREGLVAAVDVISEPSPARGLERVAEAYGAIAIVVGSSHRGRLGRVLAGGVGGRLLHGAPCAIAVAPHGYEAPSRPRPRIGVAFDGGPGAHAALDTAIRLARTGNGSVGILTVAEPIHMRPALMTFGWSIPASYTRAVRVRAEAAQRAAQERIPVDLRGNDDLIDGDPADALATLSSQYDLLVCGSRGGGPLRAVVLGSVSSALAHSCACPLLIVPAGHGLDTIDVSQDGGAAHTHAG